MPQFDIYVYFSIIFIFILYIFIFFFLLLNTVLSFSFSDLILTSFIYRLKILFKIELESFKFYLFINTYLIKINKYLKNYLEYILNIYLNLKLINVK